MKRSLYLLILLIAFSGCKSRTDEVSYYQAIEYSANDGLAYYIEHKKISTNLLFKFGAFGEHLQENKEYIAKEDFRLRSQKTTALLSLASFYSETGVYPPAGIKEELEALELLDKVLAGEISNDEFEKRATGRVSYYNKHYHQNRSEQN